MANARSARLTIAPRMLTAEEAAAYLGYKSVDILKRIPIKPIRIATVGSESVPRYDRYRIDAYIDELHGSTSEANTIDETDEAERLFSEWARRKCRAA